MTRAGGRNSPDPDRYSGLAADPPDGCVFEASLWGEFGGIRCLREAPTRFEAIADVAGEVVRKHGIRSNDLGIEKLYEWAGDPEESNTWGRDIAAQLLLMGLDRFHLLGYSTGDAIDFLRRVQASTGATVVTSTPTSSEGDRRRGRRRAPLLH